MVSYKAKFGIIAGVTPIIDKYYGIEQQLGERFLKVRIRNYNSDHIIYKAFSNIGKEKKMREDLHSSMSSLLLKTPPISIEKIEYEGEIQHQLVSLAGLLATLRSGVSRNAFDKTIDFIPEVEIGTRIVKQLSKLGLGLAYLNGRTKVNEKDYQIVKRIALDTLPSKKKAIIDALIMKRYEINDLDLKHHPYFSTQEIGDKTDLPTDTCKRLLEDLRILKAVERAGTRAFEWRISDRIWKQMETAKI